MVKYFEKKHAQQSLLWRRVFAGLLFSYAGFMIYCVFNQAWFPWELRFHAYFMEEMHPGMPILFDLVAVVACLLAVKGLLQKSSSSKKFFWYSSYASLLVAVFWLVYMLSLPRFRWDVVWLPLAPLGGAALCLYVDHLLSESLEDINKLKTYMYNYKAL
ncbi:hypothetical protein FCM35_KLT10743 [Carex littledalei]|uniref:Uncharacterized protein n=1 Tax=Carex littledalei TaxID=544730 RepID=A0A833QME9_9POAL|nr:hypothetical protein FCM35_KLT10743 [Carex littledalei]